MAANYNQNLSAGKADGDVKTITTANTSTADVSSPADGVDFRLVFTADATNGGCVLEIGYHVRGTGTQAAGLIFIWKTGSDGIARKVDSFTVAAGSAQSTTVDGQRDVKTKSFENLPPGIKIFMSATVVSANCQFVVWANGGSFASY